MKLGHPARELAARRSRSRSVPLDHWKPLGVAQPDIHQGVKSVGSFDEAEPRARANPWGQGPPSPGSTYFTMLSRASVVFDT